MQKRVLKRTKNKEYVTEQHKPAHGPDKAIVAPEVFDRKPYRINK